MEQVTMKEKTILQIAKYKCQLAELERQFWFENLDGRFYKVNYDRITEEIRRLKHD
tara:strand:- start:22 stop:189 length:168 start_codon:yes stop_codon:yes gene_type:complete